MRISFSPQLRAATLLVEKQGDILTINGESFDFSSLPDGATIPDGDVPCAFIVGPVERIGGALQLCLCLPYRVGNRHVAAPQPLIDPPDGAINLPGLDPAEEEPDNVDA